MLEFRMDHGVLSVCVDNSRSQCRSHVTRRQFPILPQDTPPLLQRFATAADLIVIARNPDLIAPQHDLCAGLQTQPPKVVVPQSEQCSGFVVMTEFDNRLGHEQWRELRM